MAATVKQFLDTLETMRSIYPFENAKTRLQTRNIASLEHDHLSIVTQDERTGVWVELSRNMIGGKEE